MSVWTQRAAVELTDDPAFTGRVRRLVLVSLVALGVITALAVRDHAATWVVLLMVIGWALMPSLLFLSIRSPGLRYGLLVPGTAFPLGVLGMAVAASGAESIGWWLIATGLTLGGAQGIWFWFRWMPVPHQLDDPFGRSRLTMIVVHVALLLVGIATVAAG